MRRLIAIFLLVLLPLQVVWAAVEPYCLHEGGQSQSSHLGHHEHERHADTDGVQRDADNSQVSAMFDHDHSCCSCVSLLPALLQLPGSLPQAAGVASPLASYASFDATCIERPNWTVSR